jgi:hypothetical protein
VCVSVCVCVYLCVWCGCCYSLVFVWMGEIGWHIFDSVIWCHVMCVCRCVYVCV